MDKKTLEIQIKLLANQALSQVKEFGADIKNAADKAKGFTGDAKGVSTSIKAMQAEAQRTANQLKLFGLTSSDLRNTTQNLKKTILDLTDSGLKPESKEVQNLVQKYKELEEQTNKAEASEQGLFGVIGKLKNEIGSLAAVAAAVKVDKAVADLAKSSLDVNNSFQKIKDDFGIMLGDVEAGIGLFNELQEFNFWTPFDIEQTSQAAKVLVSAKVPLKDLTEYLTRFGDIAQGDAQKFQSYINAFSKASAKGKADMEVLNVYTDQGVQILDALGQQLGKTSAEIVKMASEGKISFQDLDDALNALASEGGLYYGTLEKAAMRLDAVQAGLQESVKSLKASFGQMLAPAVSAVLTVFTNLVDKINSSPILKGLLAAAIAAITVAVNALAVVAIVKLIASVKAATIAVAGLGAAINTALPIIGAISVVVGVVTTALVANASAHQKAADAAAEHAKKMKELDNSYKDWLKTANQSEAMAAYENYSKQAASQKTTVTNLKQKLENTSQKVWVSSASGNTSWQKDNPEYKKLEAQVKEAEELLADYEQKRDAASRRITQAQREEVQKREDIQKKLAEAAEKLGTNWQNKLAEAAAQNPVDKLMIEKQQALEKLADDAKKAAKGTKYEDDISNWDAYLKEKAALSEYYNKKIADENVKAQKVLQDWIDQEDPVGALKRQELEALNKNTEAAKQLWGDAYATKAEYIQANAALENQYAKKIAEETNKAHKVLQDWIDKGDPVGALERQKAESQKQLAEAAKKLYGETYAKEAEYIRANAELTKQYDKEIAEARKKNNPTVAQEAATAANSAIQGTDVGTIVSTMQSGGSVWGALLQIVLKAVGSLESFQKGLNLITETLKKVFTRLEPLLKNAMNIIEKILDALADALTPIFAIIIALCNEFTKLLFQGLKPIFKIIELIGNILIDIFNEVVVPISEVITDIINAIIGFINDIFGADLDYLEAFEKIVIATEDLTDEIEKQQNLLKKKYERMQDAVKEQLQSQLDALKSQYELGLISREEYESEAEKYAAEADEKLYDLEEEMNKTLKDIDANTYAALSSSEKEHAQNLKSGLDLGISMDKLSELDPSGLADAVKSKDWKSAAVTVATGGLVNPNDSVIDNVLNVATGGVYKVTKKAVEKAVEKVGDFFSKVLHFDVGTSYLPADQLAMVHQGEIIVPRTFSDGIRSGELTLSRSSDNRQSASAIYVTVTVGGSVLSENQLVDSVYNGLVRGIESRRYEPLGA